MVIKTEKDIALLPCTVLKGIGTKLAEKLQKCGIYTLQDLLFYLPSHYQDRTHVTPVESLRSGDYAVVEGVISHREVKNARRASLNLELRDGTGSVNLRFFHFTQSQLENLAPGTRLRCFGEVRTSFLGKELIHPEYQRFFTDAPVPVEETLTPIYPTVSGLTQKIFRTLTNQVLDLLQTNTVLKEYLPEVIIKEYQFPTLTEALFFVHRPPPDACKAMLEAGTHPAQQRLAFEELLAHRLSLLQLRQEAKRQTAAQLKVTVPRHTPQFIDNLPFALTAAQLRVVEEIYLDLALAQPMLRLVQGDVGSGKTLVAALAMLRAVESGCQAALMAPTELLAEQHYNNFQLWFQQLGITVEWLVGRHKGKNREKILERVSNGEARVLIGTHALFQEAVKFENLGLVVIDEQHRFGVHQRLALREKGLQGENYPHQLIMTATPIPRTLAMTAYADLDISIIDELPPGRTPIKTVVTSYKKREEIIERVKEACLKKRQAYWVCPLIDESEILSCQAAETVKAALSQRLTDLEIGLIHGRTKPLEKQSIMRDFKEGKIDLLVATSVIEVGVDVPNASLMVIENAERLGLAQLHQLRGRVGRGAMASYCVLIYQSPLSENARSRLQVMKESTDGFLIAQKDLEIRGAGELLGTRQAGIMHLKIANLQRDQALLPLVQKAAAQLMAHFKENVTLLIQRWFAASEKYGQV